MRWEIVRTVRTENSTIGRFTAYSATGATLLQLATLENTWRNNKRSVSCIPEGVYKVKKRTDSSWNDDHKRKFGTDFIVGIIGVPDRSGIIIHEGNTDKDTEGCVLLGLNSKVDKVYPSVPAVRKFYKLCKEVGVPSVIEIKEDIRNGK